MKITCSMLIGLLLVTTIATAAVAQEEPAPAGQETTTTTATTTAGEPAAYANRDETRAAFMAVLNRYPPQVSRVLKLDPSLFSNTSYLATYPALAEFVARHPEVKHTPAFYLESVWVPNEVAPTTASERVWERMMEGIVMLIVVGTLAWLIRTLIEHRRWSRVTRTQLEVHGKLMDRLTSNEDLLAYMQTPAGKRFLESAPIPLDAGPRAVAAPISRILWSVQVGLILAMAGFGMQFISRTVDPSASQPVLAMGVLALAVGTGFLLSALVSFVMSKRLGLIAPAESASPAE